MGAGRRTQTYLGPHFPNAGSSSSSSSIAQFLNLPVGELASVIFGCTHATYDECVNQLIFGLPRHHYSYIKNIQPGMPLFLFNYSDRKLHGIFEADSCGELDINPYAWTGGKAGKTQFSAQVRVRVKRLCSPLSEKVFKEAIAANYNKDQEKHFYFELNHVQTDMLLSLFTQNGTYRSSQQGAPLVWTPGGDEEGWIKPNKTYNSVMAAWRNAAPFIPAPARTSPTQSEGRSATPEHWDDGSDKVEDKARASNGGLDLEDGVNGGLEPGAEKSVDWRENVKLSNGKAREVEDDRWKAERELVVLEKLRQLKQKGKVHRNPEIRVEAQQEVQQHVSQEEETPASSSVEFAKVQDSARVEWERLARERCLQEQTMLREERELLREKFQALDAPVAKAINKNLEICASAIAQMRQDQIKLRHVMDEAMNHAELVGELEQLRKKNASLEDTQVQMASELEKLRSDVARLSELQALARHTNQMPYQSEAIMANGRQAYQAEFQNGNENEYLQQIYLMGGHDGQSWLGSVDILCPATYQVTPAAPMLTARSYAAATVLMGSVYVFGGGNGRLWYETVETYNYDRDEWIQCPSMSLKRGSLAGATVGDRIFAVGGGNDEVYFSEVECYDAQLGQWISSTSMLSKRFGVAAAELNGALYAMGGYSESKYLASVERFDPREALWTAVAPMTKKRGSFSAATLGGKIYAIGGYDGDQFLCSVEFYEPRTNRWTETELRMHTGRACGAVACTGSAIYMFGGYNMGGNVDTVECYRERTGWEVVEDIAVGGRCFLACAVLE